jgi:hypothetical protein
LRRTPLTDLLATHFDTLKLHTPRLDNLKLSGLGRRGKTLAYGGTALALAGIGGVTAATAASAAPTAVGIAGTSHSIGVGDAAGVQFGSGVRLQSHSIGPGVQFGSGVSLEHRAAPASAARSGAAVASADRPGAVQAASGSGHAQAPASSGRAPAPAGSDHAQAPASPIHAQAPASSIHAQAPASSLHAQASGAGGPVTVRAKAAPHVVRHGTSRTWQQIRDQLASQTSPRPAPGQLPPADRLMTGPASGPQSYLPISPSEMANATAIVQQALNKHMGLRAAVIAVATAMQESGLQNINYGDQDSLGLFQQRPSMGWGTAAQITTPSYAADSFLSALATYQKADPGWAGQPLWATAQAVQRSGFPYAYAKWETQAAQLVTTIATRWG